MGNCASAPQEKNDSMKNTKSKLNTSSSLFSHDKSMPSTDYNTNLKNVNRTHSGAAARELAARQTSRANRAATRKRDKNSIHFGNRK